MFLKFICGKLMKKLVNKFQGGHLHSIMLIFTLFCKGTCITKQTALTMLNFFTLKVQSCKLYNSKYMIASTQKTNTEIFSFIAGLVFKLLSRKVLFRRQQKLLKSRILFKKIANFTGKLLQNCKQLACENFGILFRHVSDHLEQSIQGWTK